MLDLTKPITLRNGEAVRIICTDKQDGWPIVGIRLAAGAGGSVSVNEWSLSGKIRGVAGLESNYDLINPPPPKVYAYRMVYMHRMGHWFSDPDQCEKIASMMELQRSNCWQKLVMLRAEEVSRTSSHVSYDNVEIFRTY